VPQQSDDGVTGERGPYGCHREMVGLQPLVMNGGKIQCEALMSTR